MNLLIRFAIVVINVAALVMFWLGGGVDAFMNAFVVSRVNTVLLTFVGIGLVLRYLHHFLMTINLTTYPLFPLIGAVFFSFFCISSTVRSVMFGTDLTFIATWMIIAFDIMATIFMTINLTHEKSEKPVAYEHK